MKVMKRLCSILLCLMVVLSFAGCHEKDEIAVKIGDVEFTSAYYMCSLIYADMEARETVAANAEDTTDIDYYKEEIDGKDFEEWVKDEALNYLKLIAAYKTKCDENSLEISEADASNASLMASYYWSSMGYSQVFENNGVSEDTYNKYMLDAYYADTYFNFLYGKEGERVISADKLSQTLSENYCLVNMIETSFTELEEDEILAKEETFKGYVTALNDKTMTFGEVYIAENTTDITESAEESKPLDKYDSVLGAEDTSYASDHYDDAKEMATGEVKLITLEDDAGLVLIVKKDIASDPYYLESLDTELRNLNSGEEYTEEMEEFSKCLDCDVDSYAVNRFKVKKIKYPEA